MNITYISIYDEHYTVLVAYFIYAFYVYFHIGEIMNAYNLWLINGLKIL